MCARRPQQLVESREGEIGLGLDSDRAKYPDVAFTRETLGLGQQSRLTDSRLAHQHQRAAHLANSGQQPGQEFDLGIPPEEGASHRGQRVEGHRIILTEPSSPR
jgi:hypothetical protein